MQICILFILPYSVFKWELSLDSVFSVTITVLSTDTRVPTVGIFGICKSSGIVKLSATHLNLFTKEIELQVSVTKSNKRDWILSTDKCKCNYTKLSSYQKKVMFKIKSKTM